MSKKQTLMELWLSRLLDLGRRNRMIHYKPSKRRALDLTEPSCSELFEKITTSDKALSFCRPIDKKSSPRTHALLTLLKRLDHPVDVKVGDLHYKGEYEAAEKALSHMRAQYRLAHEEQGCHILYLSFGFIEWRDGKGGSKGSPYVKSPLILVPVELCQDNPSSPFLLKKRDDDIVVNPSLQLVFERAGINLPPFDEASDSLDGYFEAIEAMADEYGWRLLKEASLGLLSFQKISMYRDMEKRRSEIEQHPFVAAMLGKGEPFLPFAPTDPDSLPYAETHEVLYADSSQQEAIAAAKRGESFVMEGPPGTGKSQTITNMIAELLADGKKILFVSGKNAALQVVYRRLQETGLSRFCLPLHNHRANKREIINEIADCLTIKAKGLGEEDERNLLSLEDKRRELNAYQKALFQPIAPLGLSARDCQSELAALQSATDGCPILPLDTLPKDRNHWLRLSLLTAKYDQERALFKEHEPDLPNALLGIRKIPDTVTALEHALVLLGNTAVTLSRLVKEEDLPLDSLPFSSLTSLGGALSLLGALSKPALAALAAPSGEKSLLESADYLAAICEITEEEAIFDAAFSKSIETFPLDSWYIETSTALRLALNDRLIALFLPNASPDTLLSEHDSLDRLLAALSEKNTAVDQAVAAFGRALTLPLSRSYRDLYTLIAYLPYLDETTVVDSAWYDEEPYLDPKMLAACQKNATNAEKIEQKILTKWQLGVFDLNYKFLRERFNETVGGLFAFLARSSKNEVRRTVEAFYTASDKPTDDEINTLFDDLSTYSLYQKRFLHYENELAAFCPSLYAGIRTDLTAIASGARFITSLPAALKALPTAIKTYLALPRGRVKSEAYAALSALDAALSALSAIAKEVKGFAAALTDAAEAAITLSSARTKLDKATSLFAAVSPHIKRPLTFEELSMLFKKKAALTVKKNALAAKGEAGVKLFSLDPKGMETLLSAIRQAFSETSERALVISLLKKAAAFDDRHRKALAERLITLGSDAQNALTPLAAAFPKRAFFTLSGKEAKKAVAELLTALPLLESFLPLAEVMNALEEEGFPTLSAAYEAAKTTAPLESVFRASVLAAHLAKAKSENEALSRFSKSKQQKLSSQFAALDAKRLIASRREITKTLADRLPEREREWQGEDELSILEHETQKRRGYMPLRKLFGKIPSLLMTLKPCFMMSPLSVSYFLEKESYTFDLVIFDEASQLFPEDAIGAISRGKQVIIVGDSKQLPPTDFFSSHSDGEDNDEDDDEFDLPPISILESACAVLPKHKLLWHYRSRFESLIAFSNHKIYQGELITFPSPKAPTTDCGIEYVYLPNGIYEPGKGQNLAEADMAITLLHEHILRRPDKSLGIIAFGKKQQRTIEERLREFRLDHPEYDEFFGEGKEEPFFIKNLENVQGDERDTILFSIGYGKTEKGKFHMNFGPLSKLGGERRLNVAITRAKENIKLIGSVLPNDFNLAATDAEGARLLRSYIDYALNGERALVYEKAAPNEEGDAFLALLEATLAERGYRSERAFGTSSFRVDLAVFHPEHKGAIAAILTDGERFRVAKTARDREHLQSGMLKSMGWRVYTAFSGAWLADPTKEKEALFTFLEKSRDEESEIESTLVLPHTAAGDAVTTINEGDEVRETPTKRAPYGFAYYVEGDYTRALVTNPFDKEKTTAERMEYLIAEEGPIHKDLLFRRLAPSFRSGKLTESVKKTLQAALDSISEKRVTIDTACFITPIESFTLTVRIPTKESEPRPFEYIAKEEIALAMMTILQETVGALPDELYHEIARVFGYDRMTPKIRSRCEEALFTLMMKEEVRLVDGKIKVL